MPEYLLILLLLLIVTYAIHKSYKIKVFDSKKEMLIFYTVIMIIGVVWDNFAVYRGHWYFPGKGILGIFIGLIPLEDYLFVIVCSYFGLTIYKLVQKIFKCLPPPK